MHQQIAKSKVGTMPYHNKILNNELVIKIMYQHTGSHIGIKKNTADTQGQKI